MKLKTFDKLSWTIILSSLIFTFVVAITSWNWFPTPGDWGDIAHIPKGIKNYIALLMPPILTLSYLLTRRWYFLKKIKKYQDF